MNFSKIQDEDPVRDYKNLYSELVRLKKLVSKEHEKDTIDDMLDLLWDRFLSENDKNEINSN